MGPVHSPRLHSQSAGTLPLFVLALVAYVIDNAWNLATPWLINLENANICSQNSSLRYFASEILACSYLAPIGPKWIQQTLVSIPKNFRTKFWKPYLGLPVQMLHGIWVSWIMSPQYVVGAGWRRKSFHIFWKFASTAHLSPALETKIFLRILKILNMFYPQVVRLSSRLARCAIFFLFPSGTISFCPLVAFCFVSGPSACCLGARALCLVEKHIFTES